MCLALTLEVICPPGHRRLNEWPPHSESEYHIVFVSVKGKLDVLCSDRNVDRRGHRRDYGEEARK